MANVFAVQSDQYWASVASAGYTFNRPVNLCAKEKYMSRKKWWVGLTEGESVNVIILQFDLGSHTEAAKVMNTQFQAFKEFKKFGETLERKLSPLGFACLHWLGDGGLFAKRHKTNKDAESVCDAADAAFGVFREKWKASHTRLTLRITATLLQEVFISKEAGYWYSLRLNQFLKYERQIGRGGAFVITSELLQKMDNYSPSYVRFKKSKSRLISINEGVSFTAVADRRYSPKVKPKPGSFEVWLENQSLPEGSRPRHANWDGIVVGDSLIISSALGENGYDYTELTAVEPRAGSQVFPTDYRKQFERRHKEFKFQSGKKASVKWCTPRLSEDPTLRIHWEMIDYAHARAFHDVIEKNIKIWGHFSPAATVVEPRRFPGILVTQNVLILKPDAKSKYLLLAHRRKGGRPGGYQNNCWSVSFEEQFFPVESVREGRTFTADRDLQSTVLRGAKEEFLGEGFDGGYSVSLHAVLVETIYLNLGVMGAVVLPGVEFSDLVKMWSHRDTIDRKEHDALLALPIKSEILHRCLDADSLPQEFWSTYAKAGQDDLAREDHLWHPTNKARLALCLWLLECGAI